jgi:hypothetical protein
MAFTIASGGALRTSAMPVTPASVCKHDLSGFRVPDSIREYPLSMKEQLA